jgi:hypothetical protein
LELAPFLPEIPASVILLILPPFLIQLLQTEERHSSSEKEQGAPLVLPYISLPLPHFLLPQIEGVLLPFPFQA